MLRLVSDVFPMFKLRYVLDELLCSYLNTGKTSLTKRNITA